jgi:hypothetical protein
MVKSIVFKVSVRRRLGGKAQLEVEASHRHGKWSKATLCMRRRRLQRKGKAPAAAFRRQGKGPAATVDAGESSSGGGCCRGRGSPEAAAAAVAKGGGGRAAPSGSKAESGGGRSTFYTRLLSLGIPVFWAMAQQFRLNCIG